jgi:hypothetical protein
MVRLFERSRAPAIATGLYGFSDAAVSVNGVSVAEATARPADTAL